MKDADNYYNQLGEPVRSCMLALRQIILSHDENISEAWRYGMPFFYYKGRRFCYLWVHKKHLLPYLGIVDGKLIEHPQLIMEKRTRMKILLIDPDKDVPMKTIGSILNKAIKLVK